MIIIYNILYYNISLSLGISFIKIHLTCNQKKYRSNIVLYTKILHHSTIIIRYFIHIGTNIQYATANPKFSVQINLVTKICYPYHCQYKNTNFRPRDSNRFAFNTQNPKFDDIPVQPEYRIVLIKTRSFLPHSNRNIIKICSGSVLRSFAVNQASQLLFVFDRNFRINFNNTLITGNKNKRLKYEFSSKNNIKYVYLNL